MGRSGEGQGRRSAKEWAKVVAALGRSGASVDEFARRHGIKPRTLAWWRWRLSRPHEPSAAAVDMVVPRLVQVDVEPAPVQSREVHWEVETQRGRLTVHGEIASEHLGKVLEALVASGDDA